MVLEECEPLLCPHYGAEVRILSVIEGASVVERILIRWMRARATAPGAVSHDDCPTHGEMPLTQCSPPAIAWWLDVSLGRPRIIRKPPSNNPPAKLRAFDV